MLCFSCCKLDDSPPIVWHQWSDSPQESSVACASFFLAKPPVNTKHDRAQPSTLHLSHTVPLLLQPSSLCLACLLKNAPHTVLVDLINLFVRLPRCVCYVFPA